MQRKVRRVPNRVSLLRICVLLAIGLASTTISAQQLANGFLFGEVTENGEPLANAKVTVEQIDTGLTRTVFTSMTGSYRVPRLPPGTYDVLVSTEDLKFLLETVEINVGEGTRTDPDMSESNLGRNRPQSDVMEEILVTATRPSDIQGSFGEVTSAFEAEEIDQLPIPRDVNAVVNMAPGTVLGDSQYSSNRDPLSPLRTTEVGLVSIHGASVAENVYFVDGLNVSNLSNGLGASILPFEFYDQVQMVTGGLRAQFGRTTGGMVNAVTKSGTNEWKVRLGYFAEPSSMKGTLPDVEDQRPGFALISAFSLDERESHEGFLSIGGPIIRDHLYIYGIYEDQRTENRDFASGSFAFGSLRVTDNRDPFLGLKIDWDMNDSHRMSLTYFSDETSTQFSSYRWDEQTSEIGEQYRDLTLNRGGDNYIVRYVGSLTNRMSISVGGGINTYNYANRNPADDVCPVAVDRRERRQWDELGCWANRVPTATDDIRRAMRLDGEYVVNDSHIINFGFDRENNTSTDVYGFSGPNDEYFRYYDAQPGQPLRNGAIVPEGVTEIVSLAHYFGGGEYSDTSSSFYLEDEWLVTDRLNVRLGLRHERFELGNPDGGTLLKVNTQWAPRIAAAMDVGSHGAITASFSRYHMPLPISMSQTLASGSRYDFGYYLLGSEIKEDGSVELGEQLGATVIYRDGTTPDSSKLVDADLDPMYQQEFTLGYSHEFPNDILAGVDYTYRTLKQAIEDIALIQFLPPDPGTWAFRYFITNPGNDITILDEGGDGSRNEILLRAAEMGYPKPVRKYHSVEFFLDKNLSRKLYLRGSYTWSHSYGNHEGLARSDLDWGSTYSGVTLQWDFLGLLDGATGNLPNDRRHSLKLFGVWKVRDNLQASFSWGLQDGQPRNAFGVHPTDDYAAIYGPSSFFELGKLSPRGALGKTDTVNRFDAGLRFEHHIRETKLTVKLDVFNIFNERAVIEYRDLSELWGGRPNPNFGLPSWFQSPRSVRIGLIYDLL